MSKNILQLLSYFSLVKNIQIKDKDSSKHILVLNWFYLDPIQNEEQLHKSTSSLFATGEIEKKLAAFEDAAWNSILPKLNMLCNNFVSIMENYFGSCLLPYLLHELLVI